MQVAHFLEADLQPWVAALSAALFAPEPQQPSDEGSTDAGAPACGSAVQRKGTWERLEELKPLGDTVDAVLRGWRLPLREQLPLTPAEWRPAVIGSHADAGALTLDAVDGAACGDTMQAVHTVHTCTLRMVGAAAGYKSEPIAARAFSAVAALPALRSLVLCKWHWTGEGEAVFVPCASRFSALTRLELGTETLESCGAFWTELAVELGNSLRGLTRLVHVRLPDGSARDHEPGAFAPLSSLTALTFLYLGSDVDIRGATASALVRSLRHLTALEELRTPGSFLDAAVTTALAALTNLQALDLRSTKFFFSRDSSRVEALARSLRQLPRLTELRLGINGGGAAGAATLAAPLALLTALHVLDLVSNCPLAAGMQVLAPALRNLSRLTELRLENSKHDPRRDRIDAAGAEALAAPLALLTALQLLNLGFNDFQPAGMEALAPALRHLPRLTELRLGDNRIGATGAAALAPPLALLTALQALDLSLNDICSSGAEAFAPALRDLTRLTELHLGRNRIDSAGAEAFAATLALLTALVVLDMECNGIDAAGAEALAPALARLTRLTRVQLRYNIVPYDEWKRLLPAFAPNCICSL